MPVTSVTFDRINFFYSAVFIDLDFIVFKLINNKLTGTHFLTNVTALVATSKSIDYNN